MFIHKVSGKHDGEILVKFEVLCDHIEKNSFLSITKKTPNLQPVSPKINACCADVDNNIL